jgi:hypothetical protein
MENGDKERTENINEGFNIEQLEIIRDPIVAFLIIKVKNSNESFHINTVPITIDWNNFNEDNSVCAEDEVIGVVSAPQHSYMVSGLFPRKGVKYPDSGTFKPLGYEFEGAYCPDWKKELERRIKDGEIEDSLEDEDEI